MTDTPTHDAPVLSWLSDELAALEAVGLRRSRRTVTPLPGGRCEINGQRLINFATNDYLGLAGDSRLAQAAVQAATDSGTGSRASQLITGRTPWHERLEAQIAAFEGTAAALLFPSGYAANIGTITALVGKGDVVCGDRLNHASLIDGCRLSEATFRVYPHCDVDRLDQELRKHVGARRRLIVTDGLFSMDGNLAPLPELCDVADQHQAMLLVDEAHGTGVLGERGRGAAEALAVEHRVPIRIGTLSKAIGSQGGFVAGSQNLIDWLLNQARSQIYSTALAPGACAAATAALKIIQDEPQRRERLSTLSKTLQSRLTELGFIDRESVAGPIVPIVLGEAAAVMEAARRLEEAGILVAAIRPPSVPRGTARLRISLTAEHTEDDLNRLCDLLPKVLPIRRTNSAHAEHD